jgi:peptidoglycan hydrolase-like protein with peptidoglycan-binding domain
MVETFNCETTNLKKGSKGEKVTLLQKHLRTLGYYVTYNGHRLVVDGNYGAYTVWAVKKFQKATGHTQDGWFGPKTCKSLNAKIGVDTSKATSTQQGGGTSSKGNSSQSVPSTVVKPVDPYKVDTGKNVFSRDNANLSIDGIYLIVSNVTFTNEWKAPSWKRIDLMNGGQYKYLGSVAPREFGVDCIMTKAEFNKLSNEFYKMLHRECNVVTDLFPSGTYTLDISLSYQNVLTRKVTLKFTECI